MGNDLLVLEASSIIAGYRILNSLPPTHPVRVLDAEPIGGGRFLILLKGGGRDLADLAKMNMDSVTDHELIMGIDQNVLDAAYSLASVKMSEALLIVETETASAFFSLAQMLTTQHGLKPIEIRIRKSGLSGAYGYFTGTSLQCAPAAEDCRTRLKKSMREGDIEVFDQPNAAVQNLF